jgi:hypothetical protein
MGIVGAAASVKRLAAGLVLFHALLAQAPSPADREYQLGMSYARQENWEEARRAFEAGQQTEPREIRFPVELAGVAFKQNDFPRARRHLYRALALNPADSYANDFLATLYLLEGNLDAALVYWNRAGQPRIQSIHFDPSPHLDPVLLDRALALAPGEILQLPELEASRARLESLGVFTALRFDLETRQEDTFDLTVRAAERSRWSEQPKSALLSMLSGLPFQTLYPEFYNLGGSASNLESLLRWDRQKRRAFVRWSAPLGGSAAWRYRFYSDARNENWQLTGIAPDHFNLRKVEAGGEVSGMAGDRWSWSSGAVFSTRDFRNASVSGLPSGSLFSGGSLLKYRGELRARLLRVPQKRFTLASGAALQRGRLFRSGATPFTEAGGSLDARWLPQAKGDDYAMRITARAGKTWGDIPFDELAQLGLERDNDLTLQAHVGTQDGRKGSAPLGRDYFLLNWEQDKIVYRGPLVFVKLGPFVDSGRIFHPLPGLAPDKWMWDVGVQCKISVFGVAVATLSFGKDLRSGNNAFYAGRP